MDLHDGQCVVVGLFDLTGGYIDHVVLYENTDGCLTRIIASSDFGPFDDYTHRLQWLLRNLRLAGTAPSR